MFEQERKRGVRKKCGYSSDSGNTECVKRLDVRAVALIANYCKTKDLAGGPACRAAVR